MAVICEYCNFRLDCYILCWYLLCPRQIGGIINWALSVCLVPRHIREGKDLGSPNLAGWKPITRVTREVVNFFRGQNVNKVKVTRLTNAKTVNAQYLPNGKAYELQTWYTDGARRPASPTSAVTFEVKGQCSKVTWRVWQVLARQESLRHILASPG